MVETYYNPSRVWLCSIHIHLPPLGEHRHQQFRPNKAGEQEWKRCEPSQRKIRRCQHGIKRGKCNIALPRFHFTHTGY